MPCAHAARSQPLRYNRSHPSPAFRNMTRGRDQTRKVFGFARRGRVIPNLAYPKRNRALRMSDRGDYAQGDCRVKLTPMQQGTIFFIVIAILHTVAIVIMLFGINGNS